ncbi:MAG: STAS domain-containing protein [Phycisphaerales bacterium]
MAIDWSDTIVIAELADEPALSEELNNLYNRLVGKEPADTPSVVLNMASVTYLNSSNIAQLLRLRKRLDECGRRLKICCVSDQVWSVMLVTGLDKVFRFLPDTASALASLQLEEGK